MNLVQYAVGLATIAPLALWLETGDGGLTPELVPVARLADRGQLDRGGLAADLHDQTERSGSRLRPVLPRPRSQLSSAGCCLDEVLGLQAYLGIALALIGVRLATR